MIKTLVHTNAARDRGQMNLKEMGTSPLRDCLWTGSDVGYNLVPSTPSSVIPACIARSRHMHFAVECTALDFTAIEP